MTSRNEAKNDVFGITFKTEYILINIFTNVIEMSRVTKIEQYISQSLKDQIKKDVSRHKKVKRLVVN